MSFIQHSIQKILFLISVFVVVTFASYSYANQEAEVLSLTDAPNVPSPITRKNSKKVIVHLEVQEIIGKLTNGIEYTFWTFGGKVPGKFIRVREGDLVEFHLHNHPDNKMPHNIDLHAVIGPGGGAEASLVAPGHSSVFSFKALYPGLYVYHCAAAPVVMHIGNGMFGLILVEPKEGMSPVDHEYYIMQSDFYLSEKKKDNILRSFNLNKAIDEKPDYVLFNGSVNALSENNALQAKTGEKIRLYVGNAGPNLISSFHMIGGIFENVWTSGDEKFVQKNVQTLSIAAGSAARIEFQTKVPGDFILVDHSLSRAFHKGALGQLHVVGQENKEIFSGKIQESIYNPKEKKIAKQSISSAAPTKQNENLNGKIIYQQKCMACHQENGAGIPNVFPPLAKSDFLNQNVPRSVTVVAEGLQGKITVNGKTYNSVMPNLELSDEEIATVITYVYNSWDNSNKKVTPQDVKKILNRK